MQSAEPQAELSEDSVSRREFLRAGGLGVVGLSLAEGVSWGQLLQAGARRNCILVMMTGGPSQLDTFDPKPYAHADIRGTLSAIETSVPGLSLSETLPQLAQRAHRFSVLRSIYHTAAPTHETGLQLLQTGRLSWKGVRFPHVGQVLSEASTDFSTQLSVIAPQPLVQSSGRAYIAQNSSENDAAFAQRLAELTAQESEPARRMYGSSSFGERLLQARLLVEQGARCVTVNLCNELGSQITWDAHGDEQCGPATIADCRDHLCPAFDVAMSGLLDDLTQRGMLNDTLVIAVGEMGRSPRINTRGGRDHWTNCWSALVAGGGTLGGQLIGASDDIAGEPVDRPISLGELPATMLHWFGIDGRNLRANVGKQQLPLIPYAPIQELWGTTVAPNQESARELAAV